MSKNDKPIANSSTREPDSVKAMFARVAPVYDLINRVMTFGLDIVWRARLVRALSLPDGDCSAIDVACGSGDVALAIAKRYPKSRIVCSDFCAAMLELAKDKLAKKFPNRAEFVEADCANLPFGTNSFDGATVSFGFRNFKDRNASLAELARILKPNARLCILEVAKAEGFFHTVQKFFMGKFVPTLASLCGGKRADYEYLAKTTLEYPSKKEVEEMFARAGFKNVSTRSMGFGLVAITVGEKN